MLINQTLINDLRSDAWAMEPTALNILFETLQSDTLAESAPKADNGMEVSDGAATIKIQGRLMRSVPAMFSWFGIAATSYADIIEQVGAAASNNDVKSITLDINSPGGSVDGVQECADAIYAAGTTKKITARVDGVCASGAYWLASQADNITATPNSMVGSIGVYMVLSDFSEQAKAEGIKVNVIRSGEHKGAGVPGAPISDDQIDALQDVVNGMAGNFAAAVARGRKMKVSAVNKLADGRVWIASEAQDNKLIDSTDAAVATGSNVNSDNGDTIMSDNNETIDAEAIKADAKAEAKAESVDQLKELKAAFPDDLAFAVEQYEAGASVIEAKAAFSDVLAERLAEANKKTEAAESKAEETVVEGTDAIDNTETPEATDFRTAAAEMAKDEGISKTEAMRRIAKTQPELYAKHIGR